jgi:hypothetical protein
MEKVSLRRAEETQRNGVVPGGTRGPTPFLGLPEAFHYHEKDAVAAVCSGIMETSRAINCLCLKSYTAVMRNERVQMSKCPSVSNSDR